MDNIDDLVSRVTKPKDMDLLLKHVLGKKYARTCPHQDPWQAFQTTTGRTLIIEHFARSFFSDVVNGAVESVGDEGFPPDLVLVLSMDFLQHENASFAKMRGPAYSPTDIMGDLLDYLNKRDHRFMLKDEP